VGELEVSTGPAYEAEVRVCEGPSKGERHAIRAFPVDVGRGQEAAVRLKDDPDDPRLSRRHARIALQGGRLTVTDLSTNGTWIGERHLESGETAAVREGEPVWLGPHTMITLHLVGGERPGAPVEHALGVRALGRMEVRAGGITIPESAWQSRKAMVVLAYLCESKGRPVAVDRLEDALWPDAPEGARQALQTAVSRLRRTFRAAGAPEPIVFEHEAYAFAEGWEIRYDVAAFEAACQSAGDEAALAQACRLGRGDFLEGHADDWAVARRRALTARWMDALEALALRHEGRGIYSDAIALLHEAVERDPCRESAQAALIRCLDAAGRREDALRQYHDCVRALKRILNVAPGPELLTWYERLRA